MARRCCFTRRRKRQVALLGSPRDPMGARGRVHDHGILSRRENRPRLLPHDEDSARLLTNQPHIMFRLERIVLREIRLPLKEPFRISSGVVSERRICLLELLATDGVDRLVGVRRGRAAELQLRRRSTPRGIAIREWLAPRVLGRTFDGPGARVRGARSRTSAGTTWPRRRSRWAAGSSRRDRRSFRSRSCSAARATASRPASRSASRRTPTALVAERARGVRRRATARSRSRSSRARTSTTCAPCAQALGPDGRL